MYPARQRTARQGLRLHDEVADWERIQSDTAGMGDFSRCVQERCPVRTHCRRYVDQGDDHRSRIRPEAPLGSDCYYYKPTHEQPDHGYADGGDVPPMVDG